MQGETRPSVQSVGAWLYALASAVLALVAFHPNAGRLPSERSPHFLGGDLCCNAGSLPNCLGMDIFPTPCRIGQEDTS